MTQPDYVPLQRPDRVRPADSLDPRGAWVADRPADLADLTQPGGARFGTTGPDLGFGLKLAKRFASKITLQAGEDAHDAVAGAFACGAKRAAGFGRAPVVFDMEWAYNLWGYLGSPSADLVAWRVGRMRGVSHGYWHQREVVDAVAPGAFRLTPAEVAAKAGSGSWSELFLRA